MESQRTCLDCGAALPSSAPRGLCPRCLFELGRTDPPLALADDDTTDPPTPLTNTPFGDYELIEEIGRGGMGVVYKARQRDLDRLVAIKLLAFGPLASAGMIRRFRTEASAAGALHHPHIVGVYEVGLHQGQHYIVMDYVDGPSLASLVRGEPLPFRRAAAYLKTIAEAVHYAHQKAILHRDLKPSNILLGSDDRPRIADFGLARRLDADSTLTLTGQAIGSPSYMPPEQWSAPSQISSEPSSEPSSQPLSPTPEPESYSTGSSIKVSTKVSTKAPTVDSTRGKITRRSDVYALGGILYHLLTGRPPFQAGTPAETMVLALSTDPISPRLLNPALPRDLETICLKCLEKEPSKRYSTAQTLTDDLDRYLNDQPIHARPVTRLERAVRWCRRKTALASASLLILLLLVIVIVGSPIAAYRIDQARQEAVHQARQARLNQYAADINLAAEALWTRHTPGRARELLAGLIPETGDDLRGWEWHYLWGQVQSDAAYKLGEHPDNIRALALSPGGTLLASSDWGGAVALWDVPTRRQVRLLRMPGVAHQLKFYSDQILIAANESGSVSFHNVPDGDVLHRIETGAPVHAISLDPSRDRLAALFSNGELATVRVWHLRPADSPHTMPVVELAYDVPAVREQRGWFGRNAVASSPSGTELAAGYSDGVIRISDAITGNLKRNLTGHTDAVGSLAWSLDGRWLASGAIYSDSDVRIWDGVSGTLITALPGTEWSPRALAFSHDGASLFVARGGASIEVWRTSDWSFERGLLGHDHHVNALVLGTENRTIFSAGADQQILAWDTALPSRQPLTIHLPGLRAFDWSGDLLATIEPSGTPPAPHHVILREANHLGFLRQLPAMAEDPLDLAFGPDGRVLAVLTRDSVSFFDVAGNRLLHSYPLPDSEHRIIAGYRRGGAELMLLDRQHQVTFWRVRGGRTGESWTVRREEHPPRGFNKSYLAYHQGSGRLAIGGGDGFVAIWDVNKQEHRGDLRHQGSNLVSPAFSPGGEMIVSAGQDGRIHLWDARTLQLHKSLRRMPVSAWSAAVAPDGRRVAIGLRRGRGTMTTVLMDTETSRELLSLPGASGIPRQIAWSPDGTTLLARQDDGRAWRIPSKPEAP